MVLRFRPILSVVAAFVVQAQVEAFGFLFRADAQSDRGREQLEQDEADDTAVDECDRDADKLPSEFTRQMESFEKRLGG